jgi:GTPase SAR1 family protein
VLLQIVDTGGAAAYDSLRPETLGQADVFLVCYSIFSSNSLENVRLKWAPLAKKYCPSAGLMLIGCKEDLRSDAGEVSRLRACGRAPLTEAQGAAVAAEIGAQHLLCSAKTQAGLKSMVDATIALATETRASNHSWCTIM